MFLYIHRVATHCGKVMGMPCCLTKNWKNRKSILIELSFYLVLYCLVNLDICLNYKYFFLHRNAHTDKLLIVCMCRSAAFYVWRHPCLLNNIGYNGLKRELLLIYRITMALIWELCDIPNQAAIVIFQSGCGDGWWKASETSA